MITKHDLEEAIAECQGERNPNANTCIKLASYYTIKNQLFKDETPPIPQYSYAPSNDSIGNTLTGFSDSEFSGVINGKSTEKVLLVLDELMSVLQATNPRLYAGIIRKIQE